MEKELIEKNKEPQDLTTPINELLFEVSKIYNGNCVVLLEIKDFNMSVLGSGNLKDNLTLPLDTNRALKDYRYMFG